MTQVMEKKIKIYKGPKGVVYVIDDYCKGCGLCVEFCPTKALVLAERFNPKGYHPPELIALDKCSGCDLCGMYCPEFAIWGEKVKGGKDDENKES